MLINKGYNMTIETTNTADSLFGLFPRSPNIKKKGIESPKMERAIKDSDKKFGHKEILSDKEDLDLKHRKQRSI